MSLLHGFLLKKEKASPHNGRQSIKEENAAAFSAFLDYLGETVSAKKVATFKEQVAAWLTKLHYAPALRARTFLAAYGTTETCEDRVALAYNGMQKLMLIHDIENGKYDNNLPGLFSVARIMFRLEKLEQIASKKVKSLFFVDEIDVYLAFQVKLCHTLKLTGVTEEMGFFGVAGVTENDLKAAEIQVKSAENDKFSGWLSQWEPWHNILKRIEPEHHETALREQHHAFETRYDAMVDAE